jgi:lysophospholipase L1-like esterase
MHGVLAFGDSITNGGGELQWGVALQSWALWVARGLGLPYTGYAVDGATAADVIAEQIPRAMRTSALGPDARYHLGCLYIGVSDVRGDDWDPAAFAERHRAGLHHLTKRCELTLALAAPVRLGRPATPRSRIDALNAAIQAGADAAGALVLDLGDFGARNQVMADRVHPTAFGQIAIAERALALLAADGLMTRIAPSSLIAYETTWSGRLRGDLTLAYRVATRYARSPR